MSDSNSLEEKVIDLQNRLSFQEDTLQQLNQVVADQDGLIMQLQRQVQELAGKLRDMEYEVEQHNASTGIGRPPHY